MDAAPLPRAPGLPLVGSTPYYLRDPFRFVEGASRAGPLVEIRFPPLRAFMVNDPALLDEVLVKSASQFRKDVFLRQIKRFLGEGLLSSEGDFWKRQRRLIQPAFHRERIAGYGRVMVDHAARTASTWREGETFDLHPVMMHLTASIVTECLFGTATSDAAVVAECLDVVIERFSNPFFRLFPFLEKLPLPIHRRVAEATSRLDRVVRGFVEERRALGDPPPGDDLLAMLLAARDEDGSRMSDQQIRDEVLILFLAGHETTALAISWLFHELSQSPAVERRLHDELDRVLGDRDPTVDDLPKLAYVERVVHESLRLHPPGWAIGREAIGPVDVAGRRFPAGSWFVMLPWTLHRDPRFFPDPLSFNPDRWEDGLAKKLPKHAYMPFGGGPRVCIGNQFALMEAMLLVATIARRFSLRVVPGHPVVPEPSVTLRLKHGLRVTVSRRTPFERRGYAGTSS